MKAELVKLYRRFRKENSMVHVGRDAECALRCAKTLVRFRQLEADGLVRMRMEEEQENYFDVYGREDNPKHQKQMEDIIERLGCWRTVAEWFDGEEWQEADSCGMHTGYQNPLSPFENCYIIQEMRSALDALDEHQATIRETALAECCP